MSGSCGTAAAVQTVAMTAVDGHLTAGATSTFFSYRSMPYSVFSTDFSELQLSTTTLAASLTTQATCTIDRRGDKLAKIYLQFKAPAIMNITTSACTPFGSSAAIISTSGGDKGLVKHRGIIGALGPRHWVSVKTAANTDLFVATTSIPVTGIIALADIAVAAGPPIVAAQTDFSTVIFPGDRVVAAQGFTAIVQSVSYAAAVTSITLDQGPGVAISSTLHFRVEREVNLGQVENSANPFIAEDSASAIIFTKTVADGPGPATAASTIGMRYRAVGGDPSDLAAYYRPFAPALLVDGVTLLCGSQCLDTLTASALVIYHEVFVPKHAQAMRNVNATRDASLLKKWALQPNVWRMLLPFTMCTSYAKALSLVSICLHNLKISVKFNPALYAVGNAVGVTGTTNTMAVSAKLGGTAPTDASVKTYYANASTTSPTPWATQSTASAATSDPLSGFTLFSGAAIAVSVLAEYVYTGKAEREMEINLNERMVVIEHQTMPNSALLTSTAAVTTQLTFTHPIAALFATAVSSANSSHGDYQNYDGHPDPISYNRLSPRDSLVPMLQSFYIKFNSSDRTPNTDVSFYREMQNSFILKNVPDTDIMSIFFSIASPYEPQQSGSANFARLERVEAVAQMHPSFAKDNSNVGGMNAPATTTGAGAAAAAHSVALTYDVLSINVWEVVDCMMGRMYA